MCRVYRVFQGRASGVWGFIEFSRGAQAARTVLWSSPGAPKRRIHNTIEFYGVFQGRPHGVYSVIWFPAKNSAAVTHTPYQHPRDPEVPELHPHLVTCLARYRLISYPSRSPRGIAAAVSERGAPPCRGGGGWLRPHRLQGLLPMPLDRMLMGLLIQSGRIYAIGP